jgi:dolichyl-phosphate-mannose--protein O-mannosyl transferase
LIFGLLGQLFFLLAIKHKTGQQNFWLLLAGICFGASVSVKWTGLGFLLSIYLLWLGANFFEWFLKLPLLRLAISQVDQSTGNASQSQSNDLLRQWTVIRPWQFTLNLAIIPAIVYRLLWIPHLQINQDFNFWEMHKQILGYHSNLGSGPNEHPYCSLWYSWPLMLRPIGYFYKTLENQVAKSTTIYDVHAMGNPALWWFSTFAVLSLMGLVIWRTWITASFTLNARSLPALSISQKMGITVSVFILAGYLSNLLPWIKVTRCAFIYHYMGSSLFSFMALAWLLDQAFRSSKVWQEVLAGMILFLIAWAFVYWLPVYVGLPLSSAEFQSRMWLESWY